LVREEEEAYHAEDIVYPLRRLAANEPGLDDTLVRQSSMYGERHCCMVVYISSPRCYIVMQKGDSVLCTVPVPALLASKGKISLRTRRMLR